MLVAILPTLAVLLAGGASGFAPPALSLTKRLTSARFASGGGVPVPSSDPEVFFQSRIAEPADAGSVPAAAHLLSEAFPDEPFVLQYRSTNIYNEEVETRPLLDLSVLKEVQIDEDENTVTVDVGVTVGKLATVLGKLGDDSDLKNIFDALPANKIVTVAEAMLAERFRKLRSIVEGVFVANKDGTISSKALSEVDVNEDIVVGVVLSPPPKRTTELVARWYSRKPVNKPFQEGFVSDLADDVKVVVHKFGVFNNIPNIVVFVDGGRDLELPKDEWNEVLVTSPQQLWDLQQYLSDQGGFDSLTASASLAVSEDFNPSFDDVLSAFVERKENLGLWFEEGRLRLNYDARFPLDLDDEMAELLERATIEPKLDIAAQDKAERSGYAKVATPRVESGTTIEGFNGEIYDGVRGQMQEKRFQYATSSYDNMMNPTVIAYPKDEESVALAIKYATRPEFAEERKTRANPGGFPMKLMGRGGGHQYCGVSCDNDAFILSMDNFKRLEWVHFDEPKTVTGPDGRPQTITKELHVGTGHRLKEFAKFMNTDPETNRPARGTGRQEYQESMGATIPHGECPKVGIGGHSQSGGYGHTARAFGCAVDYIYGFTIVLADGEVRTVNKDSNDPADRDLYWAVLGGSPGAFGVTTDLVIHPIYDKDYPHSTAFSSSYAHSPERMRATLDILEDFINRSKDTDENAISEKLDLMMSLSSNNDNFLDPNRGNLLPIKLSRILFELECSDISDEKAKRQFDEIVEKFKTTVWSPTLFSRIPLLGRLIGFTRHDGESHYKLSEMSLDFVRTPPSVTSTGRENRRPYRKLCYGSNDKLKPGWAKAFSDLLNDCVETDNDIAVIFQVVVGGGVNPRFGAANLNAVQHRDAQLHGIVFDMFRGEDDPSIKAADALGKRFELDVVGKYQTQYPKVMAQWASHGDLDMSKKQVWEKYYSSEDDYNRLRRIKKAVDPDDIFSSRFTIPPAED